MTRDDTHSVGDDCPGGHRQVDITDAVVEAFIRAKTVAIFGKDLGDAVHEREVAAWRKYGGFDQTRAGLAAAIAVHEREQLGVLATCRRGANCRWTGLAAEGNLLQAQYLCACRPAQMEADRG